MLENIHALPYLIGIGGAEYIPVVEEESFSF